MSEVNPDPVAKLARFTPASAADPTELLFAAGRASARTHWGWKAAVAGLLLSNVGVGALFAIRSPAAPAAESPAPLPQLVVPLPEPPTSPAPPSAVPPPDEPWSYRTLRATDLDRAPIAEPFPDSPREPLTALSGRRGEIE